MISLQTFGYITVGREREENKEGLKDLQMVNCIFQREKDTKRIDPQASEYMHIFYEEHSEGDAA